MKSSSLAILSVGFRPFFIGAAACALTSIAAWWLVYFGYWPAPNTAITPVHWHAHEMIYGYAMAVVAGFLLTAVSHWTERPTCTGWPLALLFLFWCGARVLYLFGDQGRLLAGVADLLFNFGLLLAIARPIIQQAQWSRMAVVSKVALLMVFNAVFLVGALEHSFRLSAVGIYGGFYLIIGLILTVGRNLLPFFIQRGVDYSVTIDNFRWLDFASLALFLMFFILELGSYSGILSACAAIALFVVNTIRLAQWYTPGIWQKPLLWSLYFSYCFLCLGFLLFGMSYFLPVSRLLAIHAFAVGGIGVITLAMMSRVSIGHTGRNIAAPPKPVAVALLLLILAALVRAVVPLVAVNLYSLWLQVSMLLWCASFALFLWVYVPMLIAPRVDANSVQN